jgi:hypothetical protein
LPQCLAESSELDVTNDTGTPALRQIASFAQKSLFIVSLSTGVFDPYQLAKTLSSLSNNSSSPGNYHGPVHSGFIALWWAVVISSPEK